MTTNYNRLHESIECQNKYHVFTMTVLEVSAPLTKIIITWGVGGGGLLITLPTIYKKITFGFVQVSFND